ncbi:hypothetical protein BX666DRAFT_808738 [Dichotomocladium elegans]|nr:hypothetical protein BX666DRAFT_808738 [Dichotomocladium elegans]
MDSGQPSHSASRSPASTSTWDELSLIDRSDVDDDNLHPDYRALLREIYANYDRRIEMVHARREAAINSIHAWSKAEQDQVWDTFYKQKENAQAVLIKNIKERIAQLHKEAGIRHRSQ